MTYKNTNNTDEYEESVKVEHQLQQGNTNASWNDMVRSSKTATAHTKTNLIKIFKQNG